MYVTDVRATLQQVTYKIKTIAVVIALSYYSFFLDLDHTIYTYIFE